jgi:hypothetical protein
MNGFFNSVLHNISRIVSERLADQLRAKINVPVAEICSAYLPGLVITNPATTILPLTFSSNDTSLLEPWQVPVSYLYIYTAFVGL